MLFRVSEISTEERAVLEEIGRIRNALKYALHVPARWVGVLRRNSMAGAIRGSNSIEGYHVSVEDAIAAVDGEEPVAAGGNTWLAVRGYRDAMTYVLQLANDPYFSYSEGLLKSFHFMMTQYELKKNPGMWRPGSIYVRDDADGRVVYEGPEAGLVPELMRELVEELNADTATPVMIRAAMAHLNLVMIHPFSDGNGRMSRCLQTLVLGREGILEPQFCSIEEYLGKNTQEYYRVLASVGGGAWHPENDARPWVRFCLTAHYRQAQTQVRRIEELRLVWDELEGLLNKRGFPERCIYALSDAAFGYRVRNTTYRHAADISENLASRDLKMLADAGLLVASGERRGRFYGAAPVLLEIRDRNRRPQGQDDPFGM